MPRRNSKAGVHRPRTAVPGKKFDPEREERKLRNRYVRKVKRRGFR